MEWVVVDRLFVSIFDDLNVDFVYKEGDGWQLFEQLSPNVIFSIEWSKYFSIFISQNLCILHIYHLITPYTLDKSQTADCYCDALYYLAPASNHCFRSLSNSIISTTTLSSSPLTTTSSAAISPCP
jgi:hypothetical protein